VLYCSTGRPDPSGFRYLPPAPCADRGGHGQLWARGQYLPPGRYLALSAG